MKNWLGICTGCIPEESTYSIVWYMRFLKEKRKLKLSVYGPIMSALEKYLNSDKKLDVYQKML